MSQKLIIDNMIKQICMEKRNKLHIIQSSDIKHIQFGKTFETLDYKQYKNIQTNLTGKKQPQNVGVVLECCNILKEKGYPIVDEAIKDGLKKVMHKGRFEVMCQEPTIVFDGGHNEQAIQNLKDTIQINYKDKKKIYVISILQSKDYKTILKNIVEERAIYIFTNGNDKKRYTNQHILYEYAKSLDENIDMCEMELEEAIAFCKSKRDYVSFVIGSFYIYGDVKKMI